MLTVKCIKPIVFSLGTAEYNLFPGDVAEVADCGYIRDVIEQGYLEIAEAKKQPKSSPKLN